MATAEKFVADLPNATAISLDVTNAVALERIFAGHDLVVSLIPHTRQADIIEAAIKGMTHVVTTYSVSPAMRELDEEAKKAGIVVINEISLDPGIVHLYAYQGYRRRSCQEWKDQGVPFKLWWPPLGYKFYWSSCGALLVQLNPASYSRPILMFYLEHVTHLSFTAPWLALLHSPARQGRHISFGASGGSVPSLLTLSNPMQTIIICARFVDLMQYEQGECDLVMPQHKFIIEWADSTGDIITSTLERYGRPDHRSAMTTLVGVPCSIVV